MASGPARSKRLTRARRDVLLRIGKVSDVNELTPYGWKAKWAPVVKTHRAHRGAAHAQGRHQSRNGTQPASPPEAFG